MTAAMDVAGSDRPDPRSLPSIISSGGASQGEGGAPPAVSSRVETGGAPSASGVGSGTTPTAQPLVITVNDTPKPQGSKKGFVNKKTGRAQIVDDNKTALRTWREAVKQAVLDQHRCDEPHSDDPYLHRCPLPLLGPVSIEITFTLTKPASAPKTRVTWPKGRPDVDKLVRSTFDALTAAAAWKDDAQVVELVARKVYPHEGIDALPHPGALIRIWPVTA